MVILNSLLTRVPHVFTRLITRLDSGDGSRLETTVQGTEAGDGVRAGDVGSRQVEAVREETGAGAGVL